MKTAPPRVGRLARGFLVILGVLAGSGSGPAHAELPATLVVAVGGPAEDPAYLPVHVAAALGTFEAEGVGVTLRRAK
ncbi:MAG: hypothetical protein DMD79_05105, partial [Candidatus Rokuibacteriota bacterium]